MKNIIRNLKQNQRFLISSTISFGLLFLSVLLIKYTQNILPSLVPLWLTQKWGEGRLAPKTFLYIIPLIQFIFTLTNTLIINLAIKKRKNEYETVLSYLSIFVNLLFLSFLFKIISNITFFPFNTIDARFLNIIPPFILSLGISAFSTKYVIKFAHKFNVVTDPRTDTHPAMLIKAPVPRAGVLAFYIGFIITSLLFLPLDSKKFIGIYAGTTLMVILGVLDDKFKDINRYIRLLIMLGAATFTSLFGVITFYLNNPFNSSIKLDGLIYKFNAFGGDHKIFILAVLFSIAWMVWVMNTISWSNGIDGQFSGIAGITALTIALLSLRFAPIDQENLNIATLSAIAAGAIFGLTPYTWYPMKIMWGFGATAVGLVLASTSILSISKVAVASLVLLVPFLDAAVSMIRRVLKRRSPFFGDREHLHHKLLDLGWSKPQVALFYWVITGFLGAIAIASSGKDTILTIVTFAGVIGFSIIVLNLIGSKKKS